MEKDEDYSAIADPGLARWLEKTRYQDEWKGYRKETHSTTVETKGLVRRWNVLRVIGMTVAAIALPVAWIIPGSLGYGSELTSMSWIYALCATVLMPLMVWGASKEFGTKPGFISFLTVLILFPGLIGIMSFMGIVMNDSHGVDFGDVFQVLYLIKSFSEAAALLTCITLLACMDAKARETRWIDTRLCAIQARLDAVWQGKDHGLDRSDIDAAYHELVSVCADARFLDHEIDTSRLFSRLRDLNDRCNMQQAFCRLDDLRVSTLRAATGIDEQVFASMLLEMCTRYELVIDGDVVKTKDGRDMNALMAEIEGFFDQWRNPEDSKLGKHTSP